MKDEVSVAVRFLTRLIEKSNSNVSQGQGGIEKEQLETFKERLGELLIARFQNHWHPEKPTRGQAYRCIRLNESDRKERLIDQAAAQSGLSYAQLKLPTELTIWVDPKEVCCRFGEHQGSFCTLASFKNGGSGEIFLDSVNLDEIHKKTLELKEKVVQEMSTRKNGRRGPANNYKASRFSNSNGHNSHHGHSHHGHGHHSNHSPSPAAVSWYNTVSNSVNSSSNNSSTNTHNSNSNNTTNNGNHHNQQQQQQQQQHNVILNNHSSSSMDMFSSSPPNNFSTYNLAKFSPPKYGYGMASKWSSPPHPSYGPAIQGSKGDKYHWFNKATIKA